MVLGLPWTQLFCLALFIHSGVWGIASPSLRALSKTKFSPLRISPANLVTLVRTWYCLRLYQFSLYLVFGPYLPPDHKMDQTLILVKIVSFSPHLVFGPCLYKD